MIRAILSISLRGSAGDRQALTDLFQRHRCRLRRMVELRMDVRLQARVDASDVLQDAFLDVVARLDSYLHAQSCRPSCGSGSWWASGWRSAIAATWERGCGMPDRRSHSTATPCPKPARPRWRRCCWAV